MTSNSLEPADDSTRDNALVLVVDDDAMLRAGLGNLFRSVGMEVALFASAAELLEFTIPDVPCCLVLDVRLRGPSGLDLQTRLAQMGVNIPIIFMTGYGDIAMTVAAMKAGAEDFMAKPIRDQDLLDAVSAALDKDRARRLELRQAATLRASYEALTPRETEVMTLAVSGLLNKQIASQIGISEVTVKIHRGQAMRKMRARTFADLVLMAQQLGICKQRL
ncbi:two component transcriptional regulator, LuxR family [Cupriavidus sp. OV038]|uniref:response regulator transcription factor n=1 Tax=unclassified Cupriavidus TaxID=2640874 RepID=UPI0008E2BBF6|nr:MULTISPECIES: response regulator [unclassified Cupriavidus]SFC42597.1 two component transcriptional regulator, LuxR family [Cupriavidus sp. OV038]SFP31754.1 two component transcriptional regulator, LuxR family [Cupriavidus sp. OV096]